MLKLYCDLPLRFVWSAAKVEKSGEIFQKPTVDQTEKKLDVEVEMSELTLHACEYDSRLNSCKLIDIKLI